MTITKYDRFAFLPTRCDWCNRLFVWEGFNEHYREVPTVIGGDVALYKCWKCEESEKKRNIDWKSIEITEDDVTEMQDRYSKGIRKIGQTDEISL